MRVYLTEFLSQVDHIERIVNLGDNLIRFGLAIPHNSDPVTVDLWRQVRIIGLSGMQPMLDGCVLLLAAAFEHLVVNVMVDCAADLSGLVPVYHNLPSAIRSANERFTGEVLRRTSSRFANYDLERFTRNLADCNAGVVPYILNGEAIALNDRNLTASQLKELIGRLGMQDVWTAMASTNILQIWSGSNDLETTRGRAQNQLNELIDTRNAIAHGVGSTAPGPPIIHSYIRFE